MDQQHLFGPVVRGELLRLGRDVLKDAYWDSLLQP